MKCNLKFQIEAKRKEMIDSAINEGYNSDLTVKLSKELDFLMNMFNNCQTKCKINPNKKYEIHNI